MRTITQLINPKKHVYVHFATKQLCQEFLSQAEKEGFSFGGDPPTTKQTDSVIAILEGKQLCYIGIVGHLAIQSKSKGFVGVDYLKYVTNRIRYKL